MKAHGVKNYFVLYFIILLIRKIKSNDEPFSFNNQPEGKIEITMENELGNINNYNISLDEVKCDIENCEKCENNRLTENKEDNRKFVLNIDINTNIKNFEENSKCIKCQDKFVLFEGKCYDPLRINEFVRELKDFSPPNERAVINYALKSDKNLIDDKKENGSYPESNFRFKTSEMSSLESLIKNENDFYKVKESLMNFNKSHERKFRMQINEFMTDFEQNMQILMSLTNLFEQKTLYEIEKQKNSILELLDSQNVDPKSKSTVANNKIQSLQTLIQDAFKNIKTKVENYENLSNQKIQRAQNYFLLKNNKFLG